MDAVAMAFPHLGRGREARMARESDLFTAYDGYVPEAGKDLDPAAPGGPVLSANRLELLGKNPLEYFLRYVLEIKPPGDQPPDPSRWLYPLERGNLLHAVFREFLSRLRREGRLPDLERDWELLLEILEREISSWKSLRPPPNQEVLRGEAEDLRRTARIFLQEEELHCRRHRPAYFEVSLGMEARGEGCEMDTPDPLPVELPGGKRIMACGRIDRVDEIAGTAGPCFALCDYKTGSAGDYRADDPFRQGRRVQNALYVELARARLAECHPGSEVLHFEYFFPGIREHGERVGWSCEELAEGKAVMGELCEMLSRGCFPPSDDPDDYTNSDYLMAFGDAQRLAELAGAKLRNPRNADLAPLRRLRGYREDENDA
jgi:ATP-dependent helicase/nuclease subunit B